MSEPEGGLASFAEPDFPLRKPPRGTGEAVHGLCLVARTGADLNARNRFVCLRPCLGLVRRFRSIMLLSGSLQVVSWSKFIRALLCGLLRGGFTHLRIPQGRSEETPLKRCGSHRASQNTDSLSAVRGMLYSVKRRTNVFTLCWACRDLTRREKQLSSNRDSERD